MNRKDAKAGKKPVWQGRRDARGPRALGAAIARLTKPIFGKRGFAAGEIVTDWARIAGADIAAVSLPERIAFPQNKRIGGTLHLRVQPGGHAVQIQHMAPQLLDRINTYFGYGAVAGIKIIQAPLPAPPEKNHPPGAQSANTSADTPAPPSESDDPLERALEALGRRVHDKNAPKPPES